MNWSSQFVYGGELVADNSVKNHSILDYQYSKQEASLEVPCIILMIDTAGANMGESLSEEQNLIKKTLLSDSKSNVGEADLVRILFEELKLQGLENTDIGIITPYNAQADVIRKLFEKHGHENVYK